MDGFSPAAAITVLCSLEAGWLAGSLNGWMRKWRESDGRGRWRGVMVAEFASFAVGFPVYSACESRSMQGSTNRLRNELNSKIIPHLVVRFRKKWKRIFFLFQMIFSFLLRSHEQVRYVFVHRREGAVFSPTTVQLIKEQSPLMNRQIWSNQFVHLNIYLHLFGSHQIDLFTVVFYKYW